MTTRARIAVSIAALAVTMLVAFIASLSISTTPAQAAVADTHRGWALVTPTTSPWYGTAWRWSSTYGWTRSYRFTNDKVWAQPFATGWMWTWASSDGWLAMRSTELTAQATQAGFYGTITYGPLCPVEPCTVAKPTLRVKVQDAYDLLLDDNAPILATATADASGKYTVNIGSGTYQATVTVNGSTPLFNSWQYSKWVMVPAGGTVRLDFSLDTGIR